MNIKTIRDFNNAYNLCLGISEGTLGTKQMVGEGENAKLEFIPFVPKNSALAYAAKRFVDKNGEHIKAVENETTDLAYSLCLTDKDTGEILYNKDGKPHLYRFTKENQRKFEKGIDAIFSKAIDFDVQAHICPSDKLPKEIPTELYILNGLILKHDFYEEFEPENE